MLEINDLVAGYGASRVLHGVALSVAQGQVVSLLGRNGMGKTTTIKSLFGILPPSGGSVRFKGTELRGRPPHAIARLGLGLVPEGRQIFPNLTVEENLRTTAANFAAVIPARWTLPAIYQLFPGLAERRRNMGYQLSGGEQQMLAIGRALMTNPLLLVLDEAAEGLAPLVRGEIWRVLDELKRGGQSILVIDKDIGALSRLADRHLVLHKGRVVWSGSSEELLTERQLATRYLSV
jgi:branched-chain amino acid transport system ATP-binding protein